MVHHLGSKWNSSKFWHEEFLNDIKILILSISWNTVGLILRYAMSIKTIEGAGRTSGQDINDRRWSPGTSRHAKIYECNQKVSSDMFWPLEATTKLSATSQDRIWFVASQISSPFTHNNEALRAIHGKSRDDATRTKLQWESLPLSSSFDLKEVTQTPIFHST